LLNKHVELLLGFTDGPN